MSETEMNKIIAENIVNQMEKHNLSQMDIADELGVSKASVSNWCRGEKLPRMDKIDKLCELFGITRMELMGETPSQEILLARMLQRPGMKTLFDIAQNATDEEILQAVKIIEALKK